MHKYNIRNKIYDKGGVDILNNKGYKKDKHKYRRSKLVNFVCLSIKKVVYQFIYLLTMQ